MKKILVLLCCICTFGLQAKQYAFSSAPLDVVIPCTEKDLLTLDMCIKSLRRHHTNINRIIVVSKTKLTNEAEWFPESKFPFTKKDLAYELFQDKERAEAYLHSKKNRLGWLIQQLLKFYSMYVIPDISDNVFVVDADVIFLNPTQMINETTGGAYFNTGIEYHKPYFTHAKRFIPFFRKVHEIDTSKQQNNQNDSVPKISPRKEYGSAGIRDYPLHGFSKTYYGLLVRNGRNVS